MNQPHASLEDGGELVDGAPTPEATAERGELTAVIGRAIDALPAEQREVLVLRDVEGLTAPEAAAALEITVEALKSRLHRARRSLHESLRPILQPEGSARSDCPDVLLAWSRKLEGDLRRSDCAELEQHLESCPHCTTICDALKREVTACSRSKSDVVGSAVRSRVERAVRAWRDEFEKRAAGNRPAR